MRNKETYGSTTKTTSAELSGELLRSHGTTTFDVLLELFPHCTASGVGDATNSSVVSLFIQLGLLLLNGRLERWVGRRFWYSTRRGGPTWLIDAIVPLQRVHGIR